MDIGDVRALIKVITDQDKLIVDGMRKFFSSKGFDYDAGDYLLLNDRPEFGFHPNSYNCKHIRFADLGPTITGVFMKKDASFFEPEAVVKDINPYDYNIGIDMARLGTDRTVFKQVHLGGLL